jgi:hypothetical protein
MYGWVLCFLGNVNPDELFGRMDHLRKAWIYGGE